MNYSMEFTELLHKVMSRHYTSVVPVQKHGIHKPPLGGAVNPITVCVCVYELIDHLLIYRQMLHVYK